MSNHASSPDYRCYVVTGAGTREEVTRTAVAAARGGAGVVQVRSKPIEARDLMALAEAIATRVPERTTVLIDDRVDVACALRNRGVPIAGVHLGQTDLPVADARAQLGPDAVIGLTTGTKQLVREAAQVAHLIDYIGCGPFRPSPTKQSGRPGLGIAGYPPLVDLSPVPLVAIGDVWPDDVADLATTGVAGVAMVRAFAESEDPGALAARVVKEMTK